MLLTWPTFVLERRINEPPSAVQAGLRTSDALTVGTRIELGDGEALCLDTPWRPALCWYSLSWRANGRLLNRRGRLVARVEIEVDAWSVDATRLQLRPRARHVERWTGRHMQHYFAFAHDAADHIARRLRANAVAPEPASPRELVSARST